MNQTTGTQQYSAHHLLASFFPPKNSFCYVGLVLCDLYQHGNETESVFGASLLERRVGVQSVAKYPQQRRRR